MHGPYYPPGTPVRYDGSDERGPEYGIVIYCWLSEEIGGYDCYIAFFGDQLPSGESVGMPYVLRYASTSLIALDPPTGAGATS